METKVITLPVGYQSDGKLYKDVEIRPLTGRVLLDARSKIGGDRVDPSLFIDILKGTVVQVVDLATPIRHQDFFFVDADYIFFQLAVWEKEMSGEKMYVQRQCSKCGRMTKFEIKPEDVQIHPVEETEWGKYSDLQIPFKLRVPITTLDPDRTPYDTGKLRLLTIGDEVEKFKRYGDVPGRLWAETVRMMIAQIGPRTYGSIFADDLEALPAYEIKRIEAMYAKNLPGVAAPVELFCPICQEKSSINPAIMWVPDFLLLPSGE